MPYFVEIVPAVRDYLAAVDELSDDVRATVIDGIITELGESADYFLTTYPLGPESLHFRYDYAHPDGQTLFVFDFVVDGQHMPTGVVCVVYVEYSSQPIP